MNVCIEAQVLNHHRRSGLMTYTEGLVNSLYKNDRAHAYSLAYYSLKRLPSDMPGPSGENFQKFVLKVPDREFIFRQEAIDHIALPRFFKRNKIDIFHRPSGYTMPSVKGVFKVLTVHDLRTLTIGDEFWSQNISNYKKTLNTLDACVVVSECTKQDLLKHFQMDEGKIKVVYLGADKRFKPASQEQIRMAKAKYDIQEPFLLSLGSVPRKNIDGIIKGFAGSAYKDKFKLVLGCNIDVDKYSQLAERLGVAQRVVFLEKLTDEDIVALYTACHCFLFPSLYEGFGLPILEAMQCGAPVITSNMSSCPEVAGDSAILVDPKNVEEISDAIDQICKNDQLRNELIRKGFERSQLFNWDRYAVEMKKIYACA